MTKPHMRVSSAVLSSPDANALAAFYSGLLGWSVVDQEPGWVRVRPPAGGMGLSFHDEAHYTRPVWPSVPGQQIMMFHLDIATDDLDAAVDRALMLGATFAEHQPQDEVRVMLDPDGHPFCLFQGAARIEFDTVDWGGVE